MQLARKAEPEPVRKVEPEPVREPEPEPVPEAEPEPENPAENPDEAPLAPRRWRGCWGNRVLCRMALRKREVLQERRANWRKVNVLPPTPKPCKMV